MSATNAVLALCEHPRYTSNCDACEIRRMAAVDLLLSMLDAVDDALSGGAS